MADAEDMIERKEIKFNPQRGKFLIIPYLADGGTDQHEALISLYFRIQNEGLDKVVFHEIPDITLLEFMILMSGSKTFLMVLALMDGDKVADLCGMAWISDVQTIGSGVLNKGVGSFLFFKDYQTPAFTNQFRELIFDYWFEVLGIQTLVGLTPSLNRAALIFIKRMGLQEVARIPEYTVYDGTVCDGVVTWLSKQEYLKSKGS
jgi:RimJ/RimL family protein N-acetyltransferase